MLSDPRAEDAYDDAVWRLGVERIPALMACLGERERMVIRARYGLGASAPSTLRELAVVLGLSAERVRQIEHCALERMRELADGAADERPVISAPCQ